MAHAQFYGSGSEPGRLRWKQLQTDNYKIIYPEGIDSLARRYAFSLEQVRDAVGAGVGILPNENYRKPMPVILHPYNARANGMVVWTPRRMELQTTPDAVEADPQPWEYQLAVHEGRHVAQMQYVHDRKYRFGNILTGEIFEGLMCGVYCGQHFFEGDAVLAETALSLDGRGRSADFLEYYRTSFHENDFRSWWEWRYGSNKYFTPDHYRAGYLIMAGMAGICGDPDFTANYYKKMLSGWPFKINVFNKTVRDACGMNDVGAFGVICDTLSSRWERDRAARAPFMAMEVQQETPSNYEAYEASAAVGKKLYSIRNSLNSSPVLTMTDSLGTKRVGPFSLSAGPLVGDEANGRIYWAETISDPRWEQRSWSEIHWCDSNGRKHTLTHRTRYWNPSPNPEGEFVAVTEYPLEGGSAICVLDASDGSVTQRFPLPGELQAVESVWLGKELYVSAISSEGIGIYKIGDLTRILPPAHAGISRLFEHEGKICFTSDLCGVNELYSLDTESGNCTRLSNTPDGAKYFQFIDGDLWYSGLTSGGRLLYKTPSEKLPEPVRADFSQGRTNPLADALSEHSRLSGTIPGSCDSLSARISSIEARRYGKLANLFNFHSWLPLYFDSDAISNLSFESLYSSVGLGATAFFQNLLGTAEGNVYYHARLEAGKWTHSVGGKIIYSGLYPVIEASGGIESVRATQTFLSYSDFSGGPLFSSKETELPSVYGNLKIYVPLNFSSGGWYRGIIPQINLSASNSVFTYGKHHPLSRIKASVRGYVMLPTATSCLYPRLGIGMEAGYISRLGITRILSPNAYAYIYGYLPGPMPKHGIRLSAMAQMHTGKDSMFSESAVSVAPRGASEANNLICGYPYQAKFTLDYALPFAEVDWDFLCPVFYLRNFELTAHADCTTMGGKGDSSWMGSIGADICARMSCFFGLPFNTRLGASVNLNGGPVYNYMKKSGADIGRCQVEMIFGMDF